MGQYDRTSAPAPTVDGIARDRNINPAGVKIGAQEREQLSQLLIEHAEETRVADRDINITNKMCVSKAIVRDDYLTYPANTTDNIIAKAFEATKGEFENPSEANAISLPASDGSQRVVVLKPSTSGEYFQALRHKRAIDAEHAVKLRMFFIPSRR